MIAIPCDALRIKEIQLNHRGERCTFEAIIEDDKITDPALQRLALIVRAADVKGQEQAAPEGIGLRSIAEGFAAMGLSMKSGWPGNFLSMTRCMSMRHAAEGLPP